MLATAATTTPSTAAPTAAPTGFDVLPIVCLSTP